MKNTTSKEKMHTLPSEKTRWAYWMQAIEPISEDLNRAFPDYHSMWVQMSQRFVISGEVFRSMRWALNMNPEQCAAYLRVSVQTIFNWEGGKTPVPFTCFELLRVVSETVRFKMSHPGWDGWFIDYNGVLHSSDIGGKGWTPEQLVLSTMTRSEAALLRNDVKKLQAQLEAAIAENTALREMFLDNGITDEVASMQEKINALMGKINTARVIPFAPADIEQQPLEKVA